MNYKYFTDFKEIDLTKQLFNIRLKYMIYYSIRVTLQKVHLRIFYGLKIA